MINNQTQFKMYPISYLCILNECLSIDDNNTNDDLQIIQNCDSTYCLVHYSVEKKIVNLYLANSTILKQKDNFSFLSKIIKNLYRNIESQVKFSHHVVCDVAKCDSALRSMVFCADIISKKNPLQRSSINLKKNHKTATGE